MLRNDLGRYLSVRIHLQFFLLNVEHDMADKQSFPKQRSHFEVLKDQKWAPGDFLVSSSQLEKRLSEFVPLILVYCTSTSRNRVAKHRTGEEHKSKQQRKTWARMAGPPDLLDPESRSLSICVSEKRDTVRQKTVRELRPERTRKSFTRSISSSQKSCANSPSLLLMVYDSLSASFSYSCSSRSPTFRRKKRRKVASWKSTFFESLKEVNWCGSANGFLFMNVSSGKNERKETGIRIKTSIIEETTRGGTRVSPSCRMREQLKRSRCRLESLEGTLNIHWLPTPHQIHQTLTFFGSQSDHSASFFLSKFLLNL